MRASLQLGFQVTADHMYIYTTYRLVQELLCIVQVLILSCLLVLGSRGWGRSEELSNRAYIVSLAR